MYQKVHGSKTLKWWRRNDNNPYLWYLHHSPVFSYDFSRTLSSLLPSRFWAPPLSRMDLLNSGSFSTLVYGTHLHSLWSPTTWWRSFGHGVRTYFVLRTSVGFLLVRLPSVSTGFLRRPCLRSILHGVITDRGPSRPLSGPRNPLTVPDLFVYRQYFKYLSVFIYYIQNLYVCKRISILFS